MAVGQKELNPFKRIEKESGPDEYDTLWQAIDLFDPKFPEGLIALLTSSNDGVQMDGLFIFDELG